jgi:SSS family solute:Na+ symporter
MGVFGGDATHLHSWGSIFVQDVLVPLRKKPFGPRQHLFALRCSIIGVALFAFLFGALYRQVDYIFMWWSVTQAIYVGGVGSAIIGGLYWKKGTTVAAWTSLFVGSVLSVTGIIVRQVDSDFPLNGVQISFWASFIAIFLYVVVSLLTNKKDFNMDRLLHRGAYAATKEPKDVSAIAGVLFAWSILLSGIFIVGTTWNYFSRWPDAFWPPFWHIVGLGFPIFFALVTGIWFTWGGVLGIGRFFIRLRAERIDHLDDGTVKDHQNLDDRGSPGLNAKCADEFGPWVSH